MNKKALRIKRKRLKRNKVLRNIGTGMLTVMLTVGIIFYGETIHADGEYLEAVAEYALQLKEEGYGPREIKKMVKKEYKRNYHIYADDNILSIGENLANDKVDMVLTLEFYDFLD